MNRPSYRTFQRKHLRVGSRPWGRRSSRTSPPQRNKRTRPTPCPRLGSFGSGSFLLLVAQLLLGPITPELCLLLVAIQRCVLGMLRCVWCMGSLEPQPNAFPQFEATLHSVFYFQLELGLFCGKRVTRPVRAVGGLRLHALFRLFPQRQLRITHFKLCCTAVRGRELPFSAGVILEERLEMLR